MYELQAVADRLGLKSKHAARKRVYALRDVLQKRNAITTVPEHGNALAVTPEGLDLLVKAAEFDGTIAEQAERLRIEIGDREPPPDVHELRRFKVDVTRWQRETGKELERLNERVTALEQRLPWWMKLRKMLGPPKKIS